VDRTDAANRAEPAPRWRSLLDRARGSGRAHDDADPIDRDDHGEPAWDDRTWDDRSAAQRRRDDRTRVIDPSRAAPPSQDGEPARPMRTVPPRRRPADPDGYPPPPPGSLFVDSSSRGGGIPSGPPARGSARGQARGGATVNGGYAAGSAYAPGGYVPAPSAQPSPPIQQSGPPASAAYQVPTQARGRGRVAGRLEWQAPPTNAGVDQIVATLRRDLGGPRVLAFANPKGGVHKTTATVLAAATIGGARGRGVVAWDDNELRGTLGLRAGSARHARTIRHLVRDLDHIEAILGPSLLEALDDYLRHASDGSYDVLAGEENPRFAQHLDPHTVRRVLELLRRTHDVICVDTGNNVESSNWRTVLQMADQLVITTVPREDAAFTADWMLDLLYDNGLGDLVANAVTLLSCPTPNPSGLLQDLATHFATRTRAVAVVPYDPMLESGSSIDHTQLAPATRRAWLQAAGVFVEPFVR
jgi:MinD-like ATPase involved in chromosome partitioning or flagellar assembly